MSDSKIRINGVSVETKHDHDPVYGSVRKSVSVDAIDGLGLVDVDVRIADRGGREPITAECIDRAIVALNAARGQVEGR